MQPACPSEWPLLVPVRQRHCAALTQLVKPRLRSILRLSLTDTAPAEREIPSLDAVCEAKLARHFVALF
jgi:hypothetical protein